MYPKMLPEIIEAIETHFDDEPDIIADCMEYLFNTLSDEGDVGAIGDWFNKHDRCSRCGGKMEWIVHKEPHPELGVGVYERIYESYCSNCDIGDKL